MTAAAGDPPTDRGSATVLGLGALVLLLAVLAAGLLLGGVWVAAHQARTAADLGALAGAQVLRLGGAEQEVCARAADVVQRHGGVLTQCRVRAVGTGSTGSTGPRVAVRVSGSTGSAWWPEVRATADAGLVATPP